MRMLRTQPFPLRSSGSEDWGLYERIPYWSKVDFFSTVQHVATTGSTSIEEHVINNNKL